MKNNLDLNKSPITIVSATVSVCAVVLVAAILHYHYRNHVGFQCQCES